GLWRTRALTGDYHGLQRCIRNEQQCNQRQADHYKKSESWHCRVPTRTPSTLSNLRRAPRLGPKVQLDQGTTGLSEYRRLLKTRKMFGHSGGEGKISVSARNSSNRR